MPHLKHLLTALLFAYPAIGLTNMISIEVVSISKEVALERLAECRKTQCDTLQLHNAPIENLGAIEGLENVKWLEINGTNISDLSFVSQMPKLEYLNFTSAPVTSLAPIKDLDNLNVLMASYSQIDNIDVVAQFSRLRELHIGETKVTDFTPIEKLENLEVLHIQKNSFSDLGLISKMMHLRELDIDQTEVTQLEPLTHLPSLTMLYMRGVKADLEPTLSIKKLQYLSIDSDQMKETVTSKLAERGVYFYRSNEFPNC